MTETQAIELIGKIDELIMSIQLMTDWIKNINVWLSWHLGVVIPGVIILGLMYWALSQFINKYY